MSEDEKMLNDEQFNVLLEQMKVTLKKQFDDENRLWGLSDVANYFGVSLSTVHHYRNRPDFPKSVSVGYEQNGRERFTTRYVPAEVKKWGLRQRAA